ncbi:MAG: flagellar brake protein [Phycisphaerae bacterium]|nr:flagellar brake protein [Phycisphaerae bacterium]
MPAHRSRTERWLDSLWQIYERGGGIEFSVAHDPAAPSPTPPVDLVWRVRVLGISERDLTVESPVTLGRPVRLVPGSAVVVVISVGQNRWMFRSQILSAAPPRPGVHASLRLAMPDVVERCARRNFLRVSMAAINPPTVECFPLLDPGSGAMPELAAKALIEDLHAGRLPPSAASHQLPAPQVGPAFAARLVNLGGGGAGLLVAHAESAALDRHRSLWLRIDLRPCVPAPLPITARVAHLHVDSEQNTYAGIAFDFAHNPPYRDFVVQEVLRTVALAQQAPSADAA